MSSSSSEFSRLHDRRKLPAGPVRIEADEAERAALARRFDLVRIDRLQAVLELAGDGDAVSVTGAMQAAWVQSCAVSGDDLPAERADEPVAIRFVPEPATGTPDEEVELDASDLDEIFYDGTVIDIGEAVAQTLALAVDPFAAGPEADRVREEAGLAEPAPEGPLQQALKGLKRD